MCKQAMLVEIDARVNKIEHVAKDMVFDLPQDCDPKLLRSNVVTFRRLAKNIVGGNRLVVKRLSKPTRKLLAHSF